MVIDYKVDDFVRAVAEATGGRGVDTILDVIGGDYVNRNLAAAALKGRIIQVGLMGGASTAVNLGMILSKRISLIGTTLRARPIEEKIALTQRFQAEIMPLFDTGALRPIIDSRFPMEQIREAHQYMASNANSGKIIIDITR